MPIILAARAMETFSLETRWIRSLRFLSEIYTYWRTIESVSVLLGIEGDLAIKFGGK